MTALFQSVWQKEEVPQDFKDDSIVHIFKRKGDETSCDNHRGISLPCIAGKVLARTAAVQEKRDWWKQNPAPQDSFPCSVCRRTCASRTGLHSHMKTHSRR
eukprot:TRINITY_DN2252_c2_g3_i1.p3 TRINITY_DN2252_c2_g3~~TRINITY_DN2252_c2_g3_i1.p3  ORF type:complete len:101 (-),score=23.30 TRINITY_DN2252_c2_g3_i1:81-383(-)